jgi:hypothetical protein
LTSLKKEIYCTTESKKKYESPLGPTTGGDSEISCKMAQLPTARRWLGADCLVIQLEVAAMEGQGAADWDLAQLVLCVGFIDPKVGL